MQKSQSQSRLESPRPASRGWPREPTNAIGGAVEGATSFLPTDDDENRDGLKIRVTRFDSEPGHKQILGVSVRRWRRFWALVDRSGGPDACWPWRGGKSPDNYGRVSLLGSDTSSHRAALSLSIGRWLTSSECALHSCDNPPCCNPRHLRIGSKAENNKECCAKGRNAHGEFGYHKLTEAQALEIRALARRRDPQFNFCAFARKYGVSDRLVGLIAAGKKWAHLLPANNEEPAR